MQHRHRISSRFARAAGFTLIELLAVMAIIAILISALAIQVPKYLDKAKVTACRANLTDLYRNFTLYKDRFSDWPTESGIRFFLTLWRMDPDSHNESFAKRFTCPGVPANNLSGIAGRPPEEWFNEWDTLDSTYTGYAGRDREHFPKLEVNAGKQAIVADDNELADTDHDPQPNHTYTTLALFADGSIQEYDLQKLRIEGVLQEKQFILPGPDCVIPELKSLLRDAPLSKKATAPKKK
ncbi:MAG: prepilin-type N-terminal cleavage/methylation domain-containing protein [Planctomycetes bacterium]|nr:prepilin-type N-terminal cleavage/methylation domain-containing protein [Planctomycetota bacterium]